MTIYIYVCPSCNDVLFGIPESLHDENQILPCPCGSDIELWKESADVRRGEWQPEEYGVSGVNAFVMEGGPQHMTPEERAEYEMLGE